MKRFAATVSIIVALLGAHSELFACKRFDPPKAFVRSHFNVRLQDRQQPVVAMEVVVERYNSSSMQWDHVASAITDASGIAVFSGVPHGSFYVGTNTSSGNDSREIEVTDDPRKEREIEQQIDLVWPAGKVITTKSFEGTLASLPTPENVSEPLQDVRLDVIEAHSGAFIANLLTDEEGRFVLKTLPPGMYFVRLSRENRIEDIRIWGSKLDGDMPIEINPLARDAPESIHLHLMMTDCGLMYRSADQ